MRAYIVQPGDTPGSIAATYAGCPKCSRDLIAANPRKPTVKYRNGYVTFKDLRVNEEIKLPEKWFSKEFDELPKAYFEALPHPDGVTMPKRQSGVLGDYAALDEAAMDLNSLASKDDRSFSASINQTASRIDASVLEVASSNLSAMADAVYLSTRSARVRNVDLGVAIGTGDTATATRARLDIQNALSTAVGTARVALQTFYSTPEIEIGGATIEPPSPVPAPTPVPKVPRPAPVPAPSPIAVVAPEKGVATGAIVGMSLVGAGIVGSAIYLTTRRKKRRA